MMGLKKKLVVKLEASRFGKAQFLKAILFCLQDRWLIPLLSLVGFGCSLGIATFLNLWPTTPPNFQPEIKISLFDMIQSQALARAARRHKSTGDFDRAAQTWRAAIAKNPGKVALSQSFLDILATIPPTADTSRQTLIHADWLLRLTDSQQVEFERVARALAQQRKYPRALMLLRDTPMPLSTDGEATKLRSLFWLGQYQSFARCWASVSQTTRDLPLSQLFNLATQAITTPNRLHYDAFVQATEKYPPYSPEFLPARRLAIRVQAASKKRHHCFAVLDDLRKRRLATLADYFPFWALLNHLGETKVIKEEYLKAPEPTSEGEAQTLVQLLRQANHSSEALQVSEEMLTRFHNPISLWLEHGNFLIAHRKWGMLKSLSGHINQSETLAHLWSVSHYWNGVAEWFLDDRDKAHRSFDSIAEFPLISLESAWEVAIQLRNFQAFDAANAILAKLEIPLSDRKEYWLLRSQNARDAGDLEALHRISKTAYQRDSKNPEFINNYVAALLTLRTSPDLSLKLMKGLVEQSPHSIPYRLNHLHALIQNYHHEEVAQEISALQPTDWPTSEMQSDFDLARFELALAQRSSEKALEIYGSIDQEALFDTSRAWLEEKASQLK